MSESDPILARPLSDIINDGRLMSKYVFFHEGVDFGVRWNLSVGEFADFSRQFLATVKKFKGLADWQQLALTEKVLIGTAQSLQRQIEEQIPMKSFFRSDTFLSPTLPSSVPAHDKRQPESRVTGFWSRTFGKIRYEHFIYPTNGPRDEQTIFQERKKVSILQKIDKELAVYTSSSGHIYASGDNRPFFCLGYALSPRLRSMTVVEAMARALLIKPAHIAINPPREGTIKLATSIPNVLFVEKHLDKIYPTNILPLLDNLLDGTMVQPRDDVQVGVEIFQGRQRFYIGKNVPEKTLGSFLAIRGRLPTRSESDGMARGQKQELEPF